MAALEDGAQEKGQTNKLFSAQFEYFSLIYFMNLLLSYLLLPDKYHIFCHSWATRFVELNYFNLFRENYIKVIF